MVKGKILIIEDERSLHEILKMLVEGEGYAVYSAYDGKEGIELIRKDIFDIIITDIRIPYHDGFEILKETKTISPDTIVIMITAFGITESALEAMKLGAYDYINKPFKIDEIRIIINNAFEKRGLRKEVRNLRETISKTYRLDNIIGKSHSMQKILMVLPKIAVSDSNVLITGQSGCGKELIAHAIHNLSNRVDKNIVAINCATLTDGLLESELFFFF